MAGAPYQFDQTLSDDATFELNFELTNDDGTDFPWADYTFEYVLTDERGCSSTLNLTSDSGIAVDEEQNLLTISNATMPDQGRYAHACRAKHIATEKHAPLFDGFLTITEGNF